MYNMHILMEYSGLMTMFESSTGQSIGKRALGNMLGHSNRQMALYWHRVLLVFHFTPSQRRYNNKKRKIPYSNIKRLLAASPSNEIRLHGKLIRGRVVGTGDVDNVRGGVLQRQARSSPSVFASRTRATVTMRVPRYAAQIRRDPTKPNIPDEITKIAEQEKPILRRVWTRVFLNQVRFFRDRIKKRI